MRARTMVYLDVEQHRALRTEAAREGVSMAELLRRLVGCYLDERRAFFTQYAGMKPFLTTDLPG